MDKGPLTMERSKTMKKRFLLVVLIIVLLPASAFAVTGGYDGDLFVTTDDGLFKLSMGGKVQPQFYFDKTKGTAMTLTFALRRAALSFGADMHEKVSLGFTLQHAVGSVENTTFQTVQVAGAFASLKIIPAFVVTAGMVGLPLSIINEASSEWLLVIEKPDVVSYDDGLSAITPLRSSFGTPDGLGVNFAGSHWKWFYSASVISGNESNYVVNTNSKRMSLGLRTGFNILDPVGGSLTDFDCSTTPKLTVSIGSDYQGRTTDTTVTPAATLKYRWTSSAGVAARWAGFSITTEGFYRRTNITDLGGATWARSLLTDIGYYGAAGYYIIPKKFEIAAQAGQSIRQGPANDSWEFGGGLNYYVYDNNLKLQLDYKIRRFFDWVGTAGGTGGYSRQNATHNVTLMASAFF